MGSCAYCNHDIGRFHERSGCKRCNSMGTECLTYLQPIRKIQLGFEKAIPDEPFGFEMKAIPDEPFGKVDRQMKDKLGFDEYALSLKDVIIQSPPEFTIGIFGEWGTGKTTLMKKIAYLLDKENAKSRIVVPVWFNAWRYEREQFHAIIPLLETIRSQINSFDELSNLRKVLKSVLRGMRGATINLGVVTIPMTNVLDVMVDSKSTDRTETIYYGKLGAIKKALDDINENLEKKTNSKNKLRIVVFIDDLDRCALDKVLEVMESIKAFLSMEGFIYVIGVSESVIRKCINKKYEGYGITGEEFLRKIIQIPFYLPEWEDKYLKAYFDEITSSVSTIDKNLFSEQKDLIISGIQKNPREIKRFLNSFIAVRSVFMDKEKCEPAVLILLHVFQFRWPNFYKAIFDSKFLREDLRRFYNAVFSSKAWNENLKDQLVFRDVGVTVLFRWDDLKGDGEKVKEFLKNKHKIIWANDAHFEPAETNSYKLVGDSGKSLIIEYDKNGNHIIISITGGDRYQYNARHEDGLVAYEDEIQLLLSNYPEAIDTQIIQFIKGEPMRESLKGLLKLSEDKLAICRRAGGVALEQRIRVTKSDLKIGYSCWRDPDKDKSFPGHEMYQFHVIIIASKSVLDKIESVTYRLSAAWPNPVRKLTASEGNNRATQFVLKELAWGESTVYADVKIEGQDDIVGLSHQITLMEKSERLVLPRYS